MKVIWKSVAAVVIFYRSFWRITPCRSEEVMIAGYLAKKISSRRHWAKMMCQTAFGSAIVTGS